METIQIILDNIKGTAAIIEITAWYSTWKVLVEDKHFMMRTNYDNKERFNLTYCCDGLDENKAATQMS